MTSRKPKYHHGDLRRALMDAALSCVVERGVAGLSLREAARRAGVSTAAPYHHFESLEALIQALCDEGFAGLEAAMAAAGDAAGPDPGARMAALGCAYVRFALAHPGHFRLMFSVPVPAGALNADDTTGFGRMLAAMRALQAAGQAPAGPVGPLALLAWTTVHGLATLLLDGPLKAGLLELEAEGLDQALTGLLVAALGALARPGAPEEGSGR